MSALPAYIIVCTRPDIGPRHGQTTVATHDTLDAAHADWELRHRWACGGTRYHVARLTPGEGYVRLGMLRGDRDYPGQLATSVPR